MIVIPALDLRDGACVRLAGDEFEQERFRLSDPLTVAGAWGRLGFSHLQLIDLDAAFERGSNEAIIEAILSDPSVAVHVGGGVRSSERIGHLLAEGAAQVVVHARALEDPDWLAEVAGMFPGALIVAADVRDRRIATRGWAGSLAREVMDVVEELNDYPLGGLLITAVHKRGLLGGTDLALMEDAAELSDAPLYAAGGISNINELRSLEDRGISGAVIGMALYTGILDARSVAEEFSA
jgi:phosphoribosylformimino-5-aminoimidazole carboxamide ribotide isomerase